MNTSSGPLGNLRALFFYGVWAWAFLIFVLWMLDVASFEEAALNMLLMAVNLIGMGVSDRV